MTDYTKLVAAVRDTDFGDTCVYCEHSDMCKDADCIILQAADAIEALEAEHKKTVTQIFGEEQMAWEGRCKDLMYQIADLQAQLPKHGEWVEDTTTYAGPGLSNYKCSLCGKICGTWRRGLKPSELPNWCGNCGADMRKMEVQE